MDLIKHFVEVFMLICLSTQVLLYSKKNRSQEKNKKDGMVVNVWNKPILYPYLQDYYTQKLQKKSIHFDKKKDRLTPIFSKEINAIVHKDTFR